MLLAAKIASLIGAAPQQRDYFWWCLILLVSIADLSLHPRGEGGSLTASGPLRTCLLKLLNFRSWAWRTSMIKIIVQRPVFLTRGSSFRTAIHSSGWASIRMNAMMQASLERLAQAWLVPRWIRTSPAVILDSPTSITAQISPCSTMA